MTGVVAFLLSIFLLYLLSKKFINNFFNFLLRIIGSRERASLVLGIIFLPGTFVHEISHFLMALFLFVPVGRINLAPEIQEKGIKLGSVEIGRTDFIRGSLIGIAPLLTGIGIIWLGTSYVLKNGSFSAWWMIALLVFIIFQLTHTMFSSRTDLRAVLELIVFLFLVSVVLIILKINFPFTFIYQKLMDSGPFLERLSMFLLLPISIEILFLVLFRKN